MPSVINVLILIVVISVGIVVIGGGSGVLDILSVIGISKETKKINKFSHTFDDFSEVVVGTVVDIQETLEECCALQNDILSEQQRTGCEPAGVLEEKTGCWYSSRKVLDAKRDIFLLWARHITPAIALYNAGKGFEWSSFVSGVQEHRYASTPPQKATYPALQAADALLTKLNVAIALPQTTPLERSQLKVVRQEVQFTRDLLDKNFIQSEYEGTWNLHPAYDDLLIFSVLPDFAAEPDYDAKSLLYMQRLLASKLAAVTFYNAILTNDSPPQVESENSCLTWGGLVAFMTLPGLRDPICAAMTNAGIKALCYTIAASIETAAAQVDAIYNGAYCAAAATYRPATQPGLSNVHFGNETYLIWLRYMSGIDMAVDQRLAAAEQAITEGIAAAEVDLNAAYPGMTFDDFLDEYNDPENPRFLVCFDTELELQRFFEAADNNVSRAISPEFQYLSRAPFAVDSADTCCFYNSGTYDQNTNLWSTPGRFRYGGKFIYNDKFCVDRFVHSLTMHEGRTGHHLQNSLEQQVKCPIDPLWTFFSGAHEGWAAYSELQCDKTTLCTDKNEHVYNLFFTTYGTGGVLRADIALNAQSATYAACLALYDSVAGAPYASKFCDRSRDTPGQLSSYLQASRKFAAAREIAVTALGSEFHAPTFNMLLTKFGVLPWDEVFDMTDAFVLWVQDRAAALSDPWGLLIDRVLFKSADPVTGTGFTIPNTGSVLINSVQSEAQVTIAQRISSNATFAAWVRQVQTVHKRTF